MGRGRGSPLPPEIAAALKRVEHWRKTRAKRRPMPEDLWEEAASLARIHGVHTVSRALRLNFNGLKRRVSQVAQKQRDGKKRTPRGFVEVRAMDLVQGAGSQGTVVEFSDGDGGRVTIRLAAHETLDVTGLVRTFWNR